MISETQLNESIERLESWIERSDFKGYEPFDGLSSWARPMLGGSVFLERVLMQVVRRSPVNLRPLLGISRKESTKGSGYFAAGYLNLHKLGRPGFGEKAKERLVWLDGHKVERFENHSWSNHFDFSSRGGRYTSQDPIIVWTALIGHTFVDGYEVLKESRFLEVAESAARWIMSLPREETDEGACISYLYDRQSSIHNSNLLGGGFLARVAKYTQSDEMLSVARDAMLYSCSRIQPDGSWRYGEAEKYHWVDNFHTGYNLDSLQHYEEATGSSEFRDAAERGLRYYIETMFESDGCPRYYDHSKFPVDIQCSGQAIETLARYREMDERALKLSRNVAGWTVEHMQGSNGAFYYRQGALYTIKTPMLHWGQGTMFKGLTELALAMKADSV